MRLAGAHTAEDYRALARRRLPHFLFDYVDGAAGREITAARNRADLDAVMLRQRVMIDVGIVSTACQVFGEQLAMPVILGPIGLGGMLARRGELQAIRAARQAGIPFCLSTVGICSLDEIRQAIGGPAPWFQLYMMRDRGFTRDLLATAKAAGARILIVTVDGAHAGIRYRDQRSGVRGGIARQAWQTMRRPFWAYDVLVRGRPLLFGNVAPAVPEARGPRDFQQWIGANLDPGLNWDDIAFLRGLWDSPILVKGILDPEDARAAVAAGADGIIVSNHGGRQLDGARSTISALPRVVDAIDHAIPVLIDGGIRSGIDVARALALGADACLLGRAWAFALAAGGAAGVSRMLDGMQNELVNTLALGGCTDVHAARERLLDGV